MEKEALAQLIEVSHAVGAKPDSIQADGGNASVKSPDGKRMIITASGSLLTEISESSGWLELDTARVLNLGEQCERATHEPDFREAQPLQQMAAMVVGGSGRPPVESPLHAMFGRVVIHSHSIAANALNCGPGLKALQEITPSGELPPLWVPYADPGWRLGLAVRPAVDAYKKKYGSSPSVLFMENHGLLVSADDARSCLVLHDEWLERCAQYFKPKAPARVAPSGIDSMTLRETLVALRHVYRDTRGHVPFIRLTSDPELAAVACDARADTLASGALTPDYIVHLGSHALLAESLEELPAKLSPALREKAAPRVAIVWNTGTFLVAEDASMLDAAEVLGIAAAKITRWASGCGGARNLSASFAESVIRREAERHRPAPVNSEAAPLAGKVALVTGAASGLGCGIAQKFVEVGAAVAFCDVNEKGAAEAASVNPCRALPVHMDVTSEGSVAVAFEQVLRHWGGVDVVVCAAGIAPSFELVDMPVDKWRLALEVNLTGYFLVAREAARIMRSQGDGGAMVMISSKSGLDASKANSAYNATKAGELHLVRGWALELGPDGIRVNAIAPGNVFEGTNIWTPEYFKTAARKKGIKPDEVIPYYISLTALKRDIKRSDIAAAAVFLSSEAARCITGQTLVVDGGQAMVR